MAVDKLVDSTQLNSDLTSVANAIRTKGGTSAQLAFPSDFVSAIGALPSGGSPSLGSYKIVAGQFTPTATGTFTIDVPVTDTISAVKWGAVWLDDGSVASNYSGTSIGLASTSPVTGGYSCIDCMNGTSHQSQIKTAYGLEIKKQDAHTFRFHYRSYNGWLGQPETYNYFGIYTI